MRNERGGRVAVSLAAVVLMVGLSGCLPIERAGSDSAPTWGSTTDLPSSIKVVTNPTSPAAYYCHGIQNSGPLNFQLVPWSCAAHFQGQGIAVGIPADCYDVLRDGRIGDNPPEPVVIVLRDANDKVVAGPYNVYDYLADKWSTFYGDPHAIITPAYQYFAWSGPGILTSGFYDDSGDSGSQVRVTVVPRIAKLTQYTATVTCTTGYSPDFTRQIRKTDVGTIRNVG